MTAEAQAASTSVDSLPLALIPLPNDWAWPILELSPHDHDDHDMDNPPASEELALPICDFIEKIHGHNIDGRASTIGWANDTIFTVLPFLDDGSGGNLLENDIKAVTQLSKVPMITFASKSQFPFARFFTKDELHSLRISGRSSPMVKS